jgi:signal transduction histidine kinase
MQIRTRLTLQFILLAGIIMLISSVAIYYFSSNFRKEDFYNRLRSQSRSTARFVLDPYNPDKDLARTIENDNPANLQHKKIIILNSRDDVMYTSDPEEEIMITGDILYRIRSETNVRYKQGRLEVLGTLYTVNYTPFVVIAAAEDVDGLLHLKKLGIILLIVWITSLLLFFIAGWFYSGRALKPISEVINRVQDISISSLNLRVPEGNGTDEIGRLARTFNNMLERLETSFAMQKNFIANASHELRTPLTSINGQLEVLMLQDRTTEDYKAALNSVMEDIRSLINLSNRLLLIARTSAEGPSGFSKKLSADEIIWQARDDIKRFNPAYHINITLDDSVTDSEQLIVAGDENLLKVAVTNIMENACKYSSDNSVDVSFKPSGKYLEIIFSDRGIGIPERDLEKIFEPFHRGSNTISVPGSGIGLSLVRQIMKNHYGEVTVRSKAGKGTTVILSLPYPA